MEAKIEAAEDAFFKAVNLARAEMARHNELLREVRKMQETLFKLDNELNSAREKADRLYAESILRQEELEALRKG